MKLKDLFTNVTSSAIVKGISNDSREISQGMIFVAIEGQFSDGHKYLLDVKEKGAVAAVVQVKNPNVNLLQIVVENPISEMARISSMLNKTADHEQLFIGVTGTDGKTTISSLVQEFFAPWFPVGYIGTSGIRYQNVEINPTLTTPMPHVLHSTFNDMYSNQVQVIAMEVSSHALALGRSDYIPFDVGIFTNLSHDHLDFHRTMDEYFQAKEKLFTNLPNTGFAIINGDDQYGRKISTKAQTIYYGLNSNNNIFAKNISYNASGTSFDISIFGQVYAVHTKLIADFNVYNLLAVVGLATTFGIENDKIIRRISEVLPVEGRMQIIDCGQDFSVVVDMAHAPNSTEQVLKFLKTMTTGNLFVVVGSAGDRDKEKRPIIMQLATSLADFAFITEDDPHSEYVEDIIADMLEGNKNENFQVIIDRGQAIEKAIKTAKTGDVVAVLGRGSEKTIPRHNEVIEFSDVVCATTILKSLKN